MGLTYGVDNDDDDDLVFYIPFSISLVILRRWKGDDERLCAMKNLYSCYVQPFCGWIGSGK